MTRAKIERPVGNKTLALGLLLATLMALSLMLTAKPAQAKDFTVTNALDAGAGSLRQAIEDANNNNKGADTIKFNIPVQAVHTISPLSELPVITGPLTIDGYSQPGSRPNSRQSDGLDAVIQIELRGLNVGAPADGLRINASNVVVQGLAVNGFANNGIRINSGTGSKIEGNFIGTDASGTLDRGNADDGVEIGGGSKHTIGGILSGQCNLISGNNGDGVHLSTGGKGSNKIQGNLMGVQKDGSTIIGGSDVGVRIATPKNTIGGTEPGAANTIAHNFQDGVRISEDESTVGNRILSNSIFENDLGIDLRGDGRTLNDPKDPDKGENTLQNFPVLSSAGSVGDGKITIEGTLDSTPSTKKKKKSFTIQFFSSPQGEDAGKTFLGQKRVTTNKQGKASFTFESAQPVPDRDKITATATGPGGNTSEFSDPETFFID
jgi:hypothetical protein